MSDYYKILGVERTATVSEIESAYFKLKSRFNSNDLEDPYFKNLYRQILQAYNILSNENLKKKYDKSLGINDASNSSTRKPGTQITPSIEYFRSDSLLFEEGKSIRLEWKTSNADTVFIDPIGQVKNSGTQEFTIKELGTESASFTIKATNSRSKKTATQKFKLKPKENPSNSSSEPSAQKEEPYKPVPKEQNDYIAVDANSARKPILQKNNFRKKVVPASLVFFAILIGVSFFIHTDLFQSEKRQVIEQTLQSNENLQESKGSSEITEKEKEFTSYIETIGDREIICYNAEEVLEGLIKELESYSTVEIPGYNADLRHFFNSSRNPLAWRSYTESGESEYVAQLNVGLTQEAYYEQEHQVPDEFHLKKYGPNEVSPALERISFSAKDSGPPFWKPDGTWKGFEKLMRLDLQRVVLVNPEEKRIQLTSLEQVSPGTSFGYMVTNNDKVFPISMVKDAGAHRITTIQINIFSSFSTLDLKASLANNGLRSNTKAISELLHLEDYRDFYLLSPFYADTVTKYWNNENLPFPKLKEVYENAWSNTTWSTNKLLNIQPVDENEYDVVTEFTYLKKNKDTTSQFSTTRFVFNKKGSISEVFPVNSDETFKSFRDDDFDVITDQEKIRRLLKAEDARDFNKIASFYASDIQRYWHLEEPSFGEIKNIYKNAWSLSRYSRNSVLNIVETLPFTYDVEVRFEFYNNKTDSAETRRSMIRYSFNQDGLINNVYGLANTEDSNTVY